MPYSTALLTRKPPKRELLAVFAFLLSTALLATGWFNGTRIADEKLNGIVDTSAQILAQQGADQLVADNRLALQNIVRRVAELPQIHYAGVYDAAGLPLAEAGTVEGIANTITASASIYTESSLIGFASISVQSYSSTQAMLLLLIPLCISFAVFVIYSRHNNDANTQSSNLQLPSAQSPLLYIELRFDTVKFPSAEALGSLERLLKSVAQLYGGNLHSHSNFYLLDFNQNSDANLRTTCAARLWFAAFQHTKRDLGINVSAVAALCVSPREPTKRHRQVLWLQQINELTARLQGVILSMEFMALKHVAANTVVSEGEDYYALKSLNPQIDKLMRKQLMQILSKP